MQLLDVPKPPSQACLDVDGRLERVDATVDLSHTNYV